MFSSLASRVALNNALRLRTKATYNHVYTITKARMGSSSHDHHHKPYEFNPEIQKKFNLDPIPKDGVYREKYTKIYDKPFHYQADAFYIDPVDPQMIFDKNGTNPRRAVKHLAFMMFLTLVPMYLAPKYFLGDENAPKVAAPQEPIHELLSRPVFHNKQLTSYL